MKAYLSNKAMEFAKGPLKVQSLSDRSWQRTWMLQLLQRKPQGPLLETPPRELYGR